MRLQKLVREIKSCGVGFDVWEIRNPTDNKGTGKYDFTRLFANDKKKVARKAFYSFALKYLH